MPRELETGLARCYVLNSVLVVDVTAGRLM